MDELIIRELIFDKFNEINKSVDSIERWIFESEAYFSEICNTTDIEIECIKNLRFAVKLLRAALGIEENVEYCKISDNEDNDKKLFAKLAMIDGAIRFFEDRYKHNMEYSVMRLEEAEKEVNSIKNIRFALRMLKSTLDIDKEESDISYDKDSGFTADGLPLNSIGDELGLDGCALTDDEKECFCRF